jgi:quercetin dioxygenase-like cupin family protein
VQRVHFAEAAARLRAEPHAGVEGHRQVVLVRHGPLSLILFVFEADGILKEHQAAGEVLIEVLAGRVAVTLAHEVVQLGAGELISLAPGQVHSVRAVEASEMLLTVCLVAAGPR